MNEAYIRKFKKVHEEFSEIMATNVKLVDPMSMEGNVSENWRRFKRNFEIYMVAANKIVAADAVNINTF